MSNQIQVKPVVHRLIKFLTLIEDRKFKVPTFQRDFIWGNKQKIDLFDSISKEYPIGSILLWQPKKTFSSKTEIGPYFIGNPENADFYILDGFQRLSTLFGCLTHPIKTSLHSNKAKLKKSFIMFYDLEEEEFTMTYSKAITRVPIYKLLDTFEFLDYIDKLRTKEKNNPNINKLIERAKKLSSTLIDYSIPSIEVYGGSIKEAVEIFSRVNSKGIEISQDWMLSALTSNEENDFNLGEIFSDLLEDLKEYNFDNIKRDILVQCIQNSFGKVYFDQTIEDLADKKNFQETSLKTIKSIKKSIKFLFEELLVIDKKLLPYNNQLIFLTYFFNEVKNPSIIQIKKLKKWFWKTSYTNYFTINSLSKIRLAFEQFKKFTKDKSIDPFLNTNEVFSTADLPKSVSSGSVRSKVFQLFLLNHSNHFNKIQSEDIEEYKATYLLKGNKSHSNLIPIILYTQNSNIRLPFLYKKKNEMSYLLNDKNFNYFSERYFLNSDMVKLYNKKEGLNILHRRTLLIEKEEKSFVKNLGIKYNDISQFLD